MKAYSAAVTQALITCIAKVHWYKNALRSLLSTAGVPRSVLDSLPWSEPKWAIARQLVDKLAQNPSRGTPIISKLLDTVVEMDEHFPHLAGLEDGNRLVQDAQEAVRDLKDLLGRENLVQRAERARSEHRTEAARRAKVLAERQLALKGFNTRFLALYGMPSPQQRGLEFQSFLRDLFDLSGLEPRGSYAVPGEQTDGSITIDGRVLLVEARWTNELTTPGEVREFKAKVEPKLDATLGLLISMAGFTAEAIETATKGGRILVVLMDGQEVATILQGVQDLDEVIRRKLRVAAEEGKTMHRVGGE